MDSKDIKTVDEPKEAKMFDEDLTQNIIGAFGRYQLGLYLMFFAAKMVVAFHFMAIIFLAPKVSYTCGVNGTETCPCSDPIYDTSIFSRTIIMEWDLICDRRWLVSVTQMIFQLGVLLGSVLFGTAADRLGRKTPLLVALIIQILSGVAAAYSPSYWIFTFLRFLVGLTVGGTMVVAFVILMEFVGKRHRETMTALYQVPFNIVKVVHNLKLGRKTPLLVALIIQILSGVAAAYSPSYWIFTFLRFLVGLTVGGTMVVAFVILMEFVGKRHRETMTALYQVPFNMGHITTPVFGYFLRDFSDFQLAISVTAIVMLTYFVFIMETPRWLVAVNKIDKAVNVLERVAKINNRSTENIKEYVYEYQTAIKQSEPKKENVLDLFRTPNLRKYIIAMSINWLACGYCYYGVTQYVGQLSGNVFMNVAFSGSVNVVVTLLAMPLLRVVGRRPITIVCHFTTAACLLILVVVPEGIASVVLATLGAVVTSVVFMLCYLYCAELFPTVVRNAAIGFCSMISRVGSMVAPFVIDLQAVSPWMPPVAFAILPLVAACAAFLLPETKGRELMNTLEEAEEFEKSQVLNRKKDQKF